jgi:hypothetical protein
MAFLSTSPPLFVDLRAHPSRRPLPVRTLGANGLCIHEVAPRSRADGEGWSRRLGAQASHAGWNKRLQTHFQYVWGNLSGGGSLRSPGAQRRQFSDFLGTICRFPARSADICWLGLLLTLFLVKSQPAGAPGDFGAYMCGLCQVFQPGAQAGGARGGSRQAGGRWRRKRRWQRRRRKQRGGSGGGRKEEPLSCI